MRVFLPDLNYFLVIIFSVFLFLTVGFTKEDAFLNVIDAARISSSGKTEGLLFQGKSTIEEHNGFFTVNVQDAAIFQVLKQFSIQSGIQIWVSKDVKTYGISREFESLPTADALHHLLKGTSYTLVYEGDEQAAPVIGVYLISSMDVDPDQKPGKIKLFRKALQIPRIERLKS